MKSIKRLNILNMIKARVATFFVQSSSVTDLVINASRLTALNGTAQNTTISNSSFDLMHVGPDFFGHGDSITVTDSNFSTVEISPHTIDPSSVIFNDGVFSVANTSAGMIWQWAVPGQKYFFALYDGSFHPVSDSGSVVTFTILDITQDAANTYVSTDLGAILPLPVVRFSISR